MASYACDGIAQGVRPRYCRLSLGHDGEHWFFSAMPETIDDTVTTDAKKELGELMTSAELDVSVVPCSGFLNVRDVIHHCQKAKGHIDSCLFKDRTGFILPLDENQPYDNTSKTPKPKGMTQAEFMIFFRRISTECGEIMEKANQEYASDEEKFDNFVGIAEFFKRFNPRLAEITPHDVAAIYFLKHFISTVKGISNREDMEGRYKDAINYGYLMAGMHASGLA